MTEHPLLYRRESLYIGGRWLRADTAPLVVANPSTGGTLGEIAPGRASHVEAAAQLPPAPSRPGRGFPRASGPNIWRPSPPGSAHAARR